MIDGFTIFEVFHDQLRECEEGDSFTLWTRPEVDLIYAYRSGTVGGQGKVVTIHKQENPKLVQMLDVGWSVDLTLIKKGPVLKFQLTADPPEVVAERAAANKKILREEARAILTRSYRPAKRELSVQVRSREGRKFRVGETMSMPVKPIEKHLEELIYDFRLVGESGTVGWVCAVTEIRQRILRAHFNGYQISGVVTAVSEQAIYSGDQEKIWKEEECTATISFRKNA